MPVPSIIRQLLLCIKANLSDTSGKKKKNPMWTIFPLFVIRTSENLRDRLNTSEVLSLCHPEHKALKRPSIHVRMDCFSDPDCSLHSPPCYVKNTEWEYFRLAHFLLSAHDSLSPSLVGKECLCICFFLIALPSNLTIHYNTEIYLFWLHWGCQRLLKVICKLFKSQTFLTLSVCLEMFGFFYGVCFVDSGVFWLFFFPLAYHS